MARNAAFSLFSSPVVVIASRRWAWPRVRLGHPCLCTTRHQSKFVQPNLQNARETRMKYGIGGTAATRSSLLSSANPVWSNGPMTMPDSIQCTLASYCPAAELSSSLHIVRVDRRRRSESGSRDNAPPDMVQSSYQHRHKDRPRQRLAQTGCNEG